MSNLINRLKRDCKKSPGKAVLLAVVTVVALSVWGKQLWGFLAPKSKAKATATKPANTNTTPTRLATSPQETNHDLLKFDWKLITELRKADTNAQPLPLAAETRNPFKQIKTVAATPEIANIQEEPEERDEPALTTNVNPVDMGIQLVGTMVGPRLKLAQISGYRYRTGDTISVFESTVIDPAMIHQLTTAQAAAVTRFDIVDVRPNRVLLRRGKEKFELTIGRANRIARGLPIPRGDS